MKKLFLSLCACLVFAPGLVSATVTELIGNPAADPVETIPVKNTGDAFSAGEFNTIVNLLRGVSRDDNGTLADQTDDKVGIGGILAPSEALEVNGRVKATYFLGDGSLLTGIEGYWVETGNDINYPSGNVGIGIANALASLHVSDANAEVRLQHAGNSYFQKIATNVDNDLMFGTGPGGATRMTIDTDGNVGIGVASPNYALDVTGDINLTGDLYKNGNAFVSGKFVDGTNTSDAVYTSGNVGIGTSIPQSKLDITAAALGTNELLRFAVADGTYNPRARMTHVTATNNQYVEFDSIYSTGVGFADWVFMDGNVGIGTSTPQSKLDITAAALGTNELLRFAVTDGTYNPRARMTHVTATNNQYVEFDSTYTTGVGFADWVFMDGNVGIGTTSPTYKLEVSGANSDASINGIRVGRGAGDIATNTVVGGGVLASNTTGNNNVASGYQSLYSNTAGYNNVASGYQSLYSNTTGAGNVALGYRSLLANTTGGSNTASGFRALRSNTTGAGNVASGYDSLFSNTTGNYNQAMGYAALQKNTTGSHNTGIGPYALQENTTGASNHAMGYVALQKNTTGYYNQGFGGYALQENTTGNNNQAIGYAALQKNTTGSHNSAIGGFALQQNTTGYRNNAIGYDAMRDNTTGYNNTANGFYALRSNTTGSLNQAIGNQALYKNTTASANVAMGSYALYDVTTGGHNTAIGYNSGRGIVTGANNTLIGENTGIGITTGSGNTIIGANVNGLPAGLTDNIIIANGSGTKRIHIDSAGDATFTGKITAAAPTAGTHLATKAYVDANSGGGGGTADNLGSGGTTSGTLYASNGSNQGFIGQSSNNYARWDSSGTTYYNKGGTWRYFSNSAGLYPYATNTMAIGSTSNRWLSIHAGTGNYSGSVTANGGFLVDGTTVIDGSAGIIGDQIVDGSVDNTEIQDGTLTYTDTNVDSIQRRVTGACPAGSSIRAIANNGTVTCETDDAGGGGTADNLGSGGTTSGTLYASNGSNQGFIGQSSNNYARWDSSGTTYYNKGGTWRYFSNSAGLYPYATNTMAIGSTSNRWLSIHAGTGNYSGSVTANGGFLVDGTTVIDGSAGIIGDQIVDGSVDNTEIQDGTLTYTDTNVDSIQRRVTGACPAGSSIRAIANNGTVTCETDDAGGGGTADNLGSGGTTSGTLYASNGSNQGFIGQGSNNYARWDSNGTTYYNKGGTWRYFSNSAGLYPYATNTMAIGSTSNRWLSIHAGTGNYSGSVTASSFLYSSDKRLKYGIKPIESADRILDLGVYDFKWKDSDKSDFGVIAQEVEALFPEAVQTGVDGYKKVDYSRLIAPLLEVTKDQEAKIEALEARLEVLESK